MQIHTHNNRRIIQHDNSHYDIEELRDIEGMEGIIKVWAVIFCSEDEMLDTLRFTPAILVTGQDEKGNEFTWWMADGKFVDAYNEREIEEKEFRAQYPQVQKVYFSDTVMTGDQWRDIQCPLSMSTEQLDQWRENIQYSDAWSDPALDLKQEQLAGYFGKVKFTTSKEWDKRHLYSTREEQAGAAERRKAAGFKEW